VRLRILLVLLLTVSALTVPAAAAPQIIEVYPDPHAPGDEGEWIIVSTDGHSGLRVSDGEASTRLPTADRVILSNSPQQIDPPGNGTHLHTSIQLANSGEVVRLLDDDGVLDAMEYERAREGVRYHHRHGEVPVGVTPGRHRITPSRSSPPWCIPAPQASSRSSSPRRPTASSSVATRSHRHR
jgi:hypothetical protein